MLNALVTRTVAVAAAFAALSLGCGGASTTVSDQWKDPSYVAGPMKRVVVIGLRLEPASRRVLEDRFVAELAKQGVQAAPSYSIFGDTLPDRETARATLARDGYDGALALRLQRVEEKQRYVPGSYYSSGSPYGPFWGASTYDPGYVVTDKIVSFETSLWDLRDGDRVWTANTQTENPSSGKDFAKSLSKEVLPNLSKQQLVVNTQH
jgi:hypothetical protein